MSTVFFRMPLRPAAGLVLVLIVLAGFAAAGCQARSSAPEARAREFVEVLVIEPQNQERLVQLANTKDASGVTALYSSETGIELTYLRARIQQGAALEVKIRSVQRDTPDQHRVALDVALRPPQRGMALRRGDKDITRIEATVVRVGAEEWRVSELRSID